MADSSPTEQQQVAVTLFMCRAQGCTCDVEFVTEPDAQYPNLLHVHCHHDDWCPLLLARNRHAS